MCKTFYSHSVFLHPGVFTKCQLRLTKIFRVGRLFTENNETESVIAIMIILIDLCNRNKQTNCNLLLSKGFTSEKREETLWYYSVERKKSHTKQSKPDFAVPG